MNGSHRPLSLTSEERRSITASVVRFVDQFLDDLEDGPASYPELTDDLAAKLLEQPGEHGLPFDELLGTLLTGLRTGFDTAAGSHLSYIPSGGVYAAALGRFIGAATNRWTGGTHAQPGAIAIEQSVINWMKDTFAFPATSAGVLLSGGSTANLIATITARTQCDSDVTKCVVYTSERAHHSVSKAAALAGLSRAHIRAIPVDESLRMQVAALRGQIGSDLAAGLQPMLIVATAGTTDTGAIDPLDACADVASESGVWLHVDAAYGGFFVLTERGRAKLTGFERADSITVDAHKSLLLPYGLGGLLVRKADALVAANEGRAAYMQDVTDRRDLPHFFSLGPELSRPYRGLDVWLALNYHGVGAFRSELDRMLDLAETVAARLREIPTIELAVEPELSIVAFRSRDGDDASRAIMNHLNDSGDVHVSSTTIDSRFAVRLAFLNHRTTENHAARAVELVAEAASR